MSKKRNTKHDAASRYPLSSDWNFELIEAYGCQELAKSGRSAFDWIPIPNQIEIISSEQMMDAYASTGYASDV